MPPEDVLHRHCSACYSFTRCTRDGDSCEFLSCLCGAVFHSCKEEEHILLCPKIRVPCLNAQFGCTAEMPRFSLGHHLEKCPASVVMCMAEWNRWPTYSPEKVNKKGTVRTRNPYAEEGQLDYDLLMRDERMLEGLRRVRRKTRLCLRNSLTRRFPAVPLPRSATGDHPVLCQPDGSHLEECEKDEEDENENFLHLGDYGEYKGMGCLDKALSRQMQQWQSDLDERLRDRKRPPSYCDYPELEKGGIHGHCSKCFWLGCTKTFEVGAASEQSSCKMVQCSYGCGAKLHHCKMFEHKMICPLYEEEEEDAWMYRGNKSRGKKELNLPLEHKSTRLKKKLKLQPQMLQKHWGETQDVFVGPDEPAARRYTNVARHRVPVPPPMPGSIQKVFRLDLRLETITRLQTKPKADIEFPMSI